MSKVVVILLVCLLLFSMGINVKLLINNQELKTDIHSFCENVNFDINITNNLIDNYYYNKYNKTKYSMQVFNCENLK